MTSENRSDDGAWPQMRGIFGSMRQHKFVSLRTNRNYGQTSMCDGDEDRTTATGMKSVSQSTGTVVNFSGFTDSVFLTA